MTADVGDPQDLVRRWIDAYNAADEAAFLDLAHPEIVFRPVRAGADPEYHGHDGIRRWVKQLARMNNRLRIDIISVLDDHLVAEGALNDEMPWVAVFEIRDGRVIFAQGYYSDRESLERLGKIPSR
jgi:ketosteroid isomerase-like protein